VSRVSEVYIGLAASNTNDNILYISKDGTNTTTSAFGYTAIGDTSGVYGLSTTGFALRQIPIDSAVYMKVTSGTVSTAVGQVKLRR
jgi:hypothetical protein